MAIKIFIDQGHNPQNPNAGAEANGLREQDVTYEVGRQLAQLLRQSGNYEVRLSRNSPSETLGTTNASSLAARTRAANDWGADYFISIHANASNITSATGSEGYVYSLDSAATPLAEQIVAGISEQTGFPDRGVFARPTLYVLRRTAMPATLIEIGFITNPAEAYLMESDPSSYARGMYRGINRFFGFA
ncbi:MAG: N-acetylmuramoyl-L-alanine amidase [Clostridia bacterium]|nr:N-acetylmuramoyl-L-alanine amidase [Clostridia bacterium]